MNCRVCVWLYAAGGAPALELARKRTLAAPPRGRLAEGRGAALLRARRGRLALLRYLLLLHLHQPLLPPWLLIRLRQRCLPVFATLVM